MYVCMYVCTTHHTQLHKTHTVTHKKGEKLVRKEKKNGKRKLSVPVLSNRKPDKIYCC